MKLPLALLLSIAATAVFAAPPAQPGPAIVAGENDEAWRPLFSALAAQGAVQSSFTERRWFAVKREPVVVEGVLRHSAERGLSLQYTHPEVRTAIVDSIGLMLRTPQGRSLELAAGDRRLPRIDAALLPILRFDVAALRETFELHAVRDGDDWRLDFVPRTPELARSLEPVTVHGTGDAVRSLEFRRSAKLRIEVRIGETRTGVVFTPAEIAAYFR